MGKRNQLTGFIPQRRNVNKHTSRGLKALDDSIQRDGFIGAITTAADGETFAGSARLERSADIFGTEIEPIVIDADGTRPIIVRRVDIPNADDPRAKRLAVADNVVGKIDFDPDAAILAELAREDEQITALLRQDDALAALLATGEAKEETADVGELIDQRERLAEKWGVALGQIWEFGKHSLIVGDSRDLETIRTLMQGKTARAMWIDPPYGVNYVGKTKNALTIENDGAADLPTLLTLIFGNANDVLDDGAPIYVAHPAGVLQLEFLKAFVNAGWKFHEEIVWVKDSMVLGHSDYHLKHEGIHYGWKGKNHSWYGGRDQVSVLEVARPKRSESHPTMKPPLLIERCLTNSTTRNDIVIDLCAGSGSTLVACENLGRIAYTAELDPLYAATIIERMSLLGLSPQRVSG